MVVKRLARPRRAPAGSSYFMRRAAAAIYVAMTELDQAVGPATREQQEQRMAEAAAVLRLPCPIGMHAACPWSARAAVLSQQGVAPMRLSWSGGLHGSTTQHTRASAS